MVIDVPRPRFRFLVAVRSAIRDSLDSLDPSLPRRIVHLFSYSPIPPVEMQTRSKSPRRRKAASESPSQQKKKKNAISSWTLANVVQSIFLFEGIAMLITGPILFAFPESVMELYQVRLALSKITIDSIGCAASSAVQWFGALVALMGWIECRKFGRLDNIEVEAWLIADVLYAYSFISFVSYCTEGWNVWSLFSVVFPIMWAPLRVYWLLRSDQRFD